MDKRAISFVCLGVLTFLTCLPAGAETYGQATQRQCPNGSQIASLERKRDEAVAMLNNDQYALAKQLALAYYRCSKSVSDSYIHDIALALYGEELLYSLRTQGEADNDGPVIASRMNDLAAATKFPDVKTEALKVKAAALDLAKSAHDAIYGSPVPTETDEPTVEPTDLP